MLTNLLTLLMKLRFWAVLLINGGAEIDKISLSADSEDATIIGGAGNDSIYTNGKGNLIQYAAGDGNDSVVGFGGDDSIQITSGTISKTVKSGNNMVFAVGSSSITVKDGAKMDLQIANNVITSVEPPKPITLSATADKYTNTDVAATIYAVAGNDTITNSGASALIDGGAGADKLTNYADEVTLLGGAGKDTIKTEGNSIWVDGGADDDVISLGSDVINATVIGGKGNDKIYGNENAVLYQYANGDGNDYIYGFTKNDTLHLTSGTVSSVSTDGTNAILKIGSSYVTLGSAGLVNVGTDGNITVIDITPVIPSSISLSAAGTTMNVSTKFTGKTIDVTKWRGTDEVIRINASVLSSGVEIIGNGNDNSI